jgi:hypothetical protein
MIFYITNFYLNFVNVQQINRLNVLDQMELLLLNTRRKEMVRFSQAANMSPEDMYQHYD